MIEDLIKEKLKLEEKIKQLKLKIKLEQDKKWNAILKNSK